MSVALISLALDDVSQPFAADGAGASGSEVVRQAVADHERPLLGYAHSLLGDWGLAQDVVQETFIRFHRETQVKPLEHPKAWLYTVCRNRAMDLIRRGKRVARLAEEQWEVLPDEGRPAPDQSLAREDDWLQLLRLVAMLPPNQREVIRLKFQADLSYKEIAEVTGLGMGNVGYLLHHGLKRLRSLLEANQDPSRP